MRSFSSYMIGWYNPRTMASQVYTVNKGINQPIEFRGLKAQYIWFFAGGVVALIILFAILYIFGIPSWLCVAIILALGGGWTMQVYEMSNRYGEHGLTKKMARKSLPQVIKTPSRRVFTKLSQSDLWKK